MNYEKNRFYISWFENQISSAFIPDRFPSGSGSTIPDSPFPADWTGKKKFISIIYRQNQFFFLITGPGPSSLDRWLEHTAPALLVNFGICGGLDLALPYSKIFWSGRFLIWMIRWFPPKYISLTSSEQLLTFFSACRLLSSDYPVLQESLRKKLYWQSGCQLLDMEGYSLAKAAQKYSIPIILLKHLTDYCDESAASNIRENRSIWKIGLQNGLIKIIGNFQRIWR